MEKQIENWEEWIRRAKAGDVCKALEKLRTSDVPRNVRAKVANLAWRVGLSDFSLRLLFPLVRGSKDSPPNSTEIENLEYAAALASVGISEEALGVVKEIDREKFPLADFYHALALISTWDYDKAIPLLKTYVAQEKSEYRALVGNINLGSAYIFEEQYEEAKDVLLEALKKSDELPYSRSQILRQLAIASIHLEKWEEAEKWLEESAGLLGGANALHAFFLEKWRAVLWLRKEGGAARLSELTRLQQKARMMEHWESIRDLDRYKALNLNEGDRVQHLYFGTPWENYRKHLLADFPKVSMPESFRWKMGPEGRTSLLIDSTDGSFQKDGKRAEIGAGKILHRLFQILTTDFYRPFRTEAIHNLLHPGQHFDPGSSRSRILMAMLRLRKWLAAEKIPIVIHEKDGWYHLASEVPTQILVPRGENLKELHRIRLDKIRSLFLGRPFSVEEASLALQLSEHSVRRTLSKGAEEGVIAKTLKTRNARYKFVA